MSDTSVNEIISDIQNSLMVLSDSCNVIGLNPLASALMDISEKLEQVRNEVKEKDREISKLYISQLSYSKIILDAAIAGTKIGMEQSGHDVSSLEGVFSYWFDDSGVKVTNKKGVD